MSIATPNFYEICKCSVALREVLLYRILYNLDDKCKIKDRFFHVIL